MKTLNQIIKEEVLKFKNKKLLKEFLIGDTDDIENELISTAVNDSVAYKDNKNAKKAVENAIKELTKSAMEQLKEEFDTMKVEAIKEVTKQWKSK